MFSKYFSLTLAAGLLMISAIVGAAQTGELRGHVKLKQADGTTVPVQGAVIDVFRTDLTGKYDTKTDKKGAFVFAGLPYVGTYIIAVSAAGAKPTYQDKVKVGRDVDYDLVLDPGDGRRLTQAEVTAATKGGGTAATSKSSGSSGESATDKAKRAEIEAKNKEIMERNKKAEESNAVVSRTFKAGNDALIAASELSKTNKREEAIPKYTEAIAQYDEGLAADGGELERAFLRAIHHGQTALDDGHFNAGIVNLDGQFTLVECDRQNKKGSSYVDLWKLRMDGGGYAERLTFFSDYPGYKASNPVVSDDGRYLAFQMAESKDPAGVGYGIFIYDIQKAKEQKP